MGIFDFTLDEDIMGSRMLEEMGTAGYREYVEQYIFHVDHHDFVIAHQGGYPIATTPGQIDVLIGILQDAKESMKRSGKE